MESFYDGLSEADREFLDALEKLLPPVFPGSHLDRLSHGLLKWDTIRTQRCRGAIPEACFGPRISAGATPTPVYREQFLQHLAEVLAQGRYSAKPRAASQTEAQPPRTRGRPARGGPQLPAA
jgi:hypothetical protein